MHEASCVCIVENLDGGTTVTDENGRRLTARAVLVPAGHRHAVDSPRGTRHRFLYLEPGLFHAGQTVRAARTRDFDAARSACAAKTRHLDTRIGAVVNTLGADPRRPLSQLASDVGLSTSRLTHLFRAETGVRLARFRWWAQLRRAALTLASGRSLTEAAHEALFADASHFHRTFRRMFGFAPSALVAQTRFEVDSV
jgi:AraC-like DNA-binding protein